MNFIDYSTLIRDVLIDLTSIYFVSYVILYRKFSNTEMFVTAALFNIFIMIIVMAIIRTDFNIAVGFGLFALLSLIQLRSSQFTKTEMAFLFGAVTLAVLNGAGIADVGFVLMCNFVVVFSCWIIGSWSLEHSTNLIKVDNVRKMSVMLDHIDEATIGNRERMTATLSKKIGMTIQSYEIKKIDYVRDIVDLVVIYQIPTGEKTHYVDNVGPELNYDAPPTPAESSVGS